MDDEICESHISLKPRDWKGLNSFARRWTTNGEDGQCSFDLYNIIPIENTTSTGVTQHTTHHDYMYNNGRCHSKN